MRLLTVIGLLLLVSPAPLFAATQVETGCPPTTLGAPEGDVTRGGVCQVALGQIQPNAELWVRVELPAQCFPRVVNQRVSNGLGPKHVAPFGLWLASAGVSGAFTPHEDAGGEVSFYVRNVSPLGVEDGYLGFIWECESAF